MNGMGSVPPPNFLFLFHYFLLNYLKPLLLIFLFLPSCFLWQSLWAWTIDRSLKPHMIFFRSLECGSQLSWEIFNIQIPIETLAISSSTPCWVGSALFLIPNSMTHCSKLFENQPVSSQPTLAISYFVCLQSCFNSLPSMYASPNITKIVILI